MQEIVSHVNLPIVLFISVSFLILLGWYCLSIVRINHPPTAGNAKFNVTGPLSVALRRQASVCNIAYLKMYGLSSRIVKTGASMQDVVRHRWQTGIWKGIQMPLLRP